MKRTLCAVGLAALCLTWVAPTGAQVPDHLKCYKIKDPQAKATYTADLGGLVAEPGCTIKVPAKLACVPATKTNVAPTPPGTGGTGTPNTFGCYKIKCRKATLPTLQLNDQFGSRPVTPSAPKLLCAPVAPPTTTSTTTTSTTTTTTTSTTTTTTTPGPTCANGGVSCNATCGTCSTTCGLDPMTPGPCGNCTGPDCAGTAAVPCDPANQHRHCIDLSTCVQTDCTTDAGCSTGKICVGVPCATGHTSCCALCPE